MHIKLFEDLWRERRENKSELAAFWDRRAQSFNAHKHGGESAEESARLVVETAARCNLGQESRVLDIGCGPGRQALLLARRAGWVAGVDISGEMIGYARANAAKERAAGVEFMVLDWDEADLGKLGWEKSFDLVLASRTPAINSKAGLEKMIAASRGFCLLTSVARTRNAVRWALRPLLGRPEGSGPAGRDFYCAFNLLWLMGYCPEVRYFEHNWEDDSTLEDALLIHRKSFEKEGGPLDAAQREALAAGLAGLAVNGLVHEKVESVVAALFWRV